MSQSNHSANDVFEAIHVFLKELPDPKRSQRKSISASFRIETDTIVLEARKTKGMDGAIWNVGIERPLV